MIREEDLPGDCIDVLGKTHGERIDFLVKDAVKNSEGKPEITQSEEAFRAMDALRDWMFENVYRSPVVKQDRELLRIRTLINGLYGYYHERPQELPEEQLRLLEKDGIDEVVKDYIAGMTDRYAVKLYTELFVPAGWRLGATQY